MGIMGHAVTETFKRIRRIIGRVFPYPYIITEK